MSRDDRYDYDERFDGPPSQETSWRSRMPEPFRNLRWARVGILALVPLIIIIMILMILMIAFSGSKGAPTAVPAPAQTQGVKPIVPPTVPRWDDPAPSASSATRPAPQTPANGAKGISRVPVIGPLWDFLAATPGFLMEIVVAILGVAIWGLFITLILAAVVGMTTKYSPWHALKSFGAMFMAVWTDETIAGAWRRYYPPDPPPQGGNAGNPSKPTPNPPPQGGNGGNKRYRRRRP